MPPAHDLALDTLLQTFGVSSVAIWQRYSHWCLQLQIPVDVEVQCRAWVAANYRDLDDSFPIHEITWENLGLQENFKKVLFRFYYHFDTEWQEGSPDPFDSYEHYPDIREITPDPFDHSERRLDDSEIESQTSNGSDSDENGDRVCERDPEERASRCVIA